MTVTVTIRTPKAMSVAELIPPRVLSVRYPAYSSPKTQETISMFRLLLEYFFIPYAILLYFTQPG